MLDLFSTIFIFANENRAVLHNIEREEDQSTFNASSAIQAFCP
jgi:hypothetical protein